LKRGRPVKVTFAAPVGPRRKVRRAVKIRGAAGSRNGRFVSTADGPATACLSGAYP
jgi:hypothetical protein